MSFLAPLFLAGVVAGVIPVVLHLINRRRAKELPFATLRFLQLSVEQTRRRKRIHNLLLLILRIAALVLIALALAKPAITSLSQLWSDRAQTALVIVLDNSATMGTGDGTTSRWERARDAAGKILRELRDGDRVALILTGGPAFPSAGKFDPTQETIRQLLAEAKLSYEKADLGTALDQARKMLDEVDAANKSIFFITDRQAASWPELEEETDGEQPADNSSIPVVVVDCRSEKNAPNLAISDIRTTTMVPIARFPFIVTAELFNTSDTAVQRHVELYLDGLRLDTSPAIEVPPGERVNCAFTFKVEASGEHRGKIRLSGNDASKLDDERFFAVSINRDIPIAIVQSKPHEIAHLDDTFYLTRALGVQKSGTETSSLGIRVTRLDAADLTGEPLGGYRTIFCVNLPALDEPTARRLADYVAGGGNLIWIAGNQVDPDAYNKMNQAVGGQLLPGTITASHDAQQDPDRDSWHLNELNEEARSTANFAKDPAQFQSVLVYRYLGIDSNDARPLARLDNGETLLCERGLGEGHVWWLGTTVQIDWTNFPVRPIFRPFWVQLVHDLSSSRRLPTSVLAGHPLRMSLDALDAADHVELRPPSGEQLRLAVKQPSDAASNASTFEYDDTYQVGVYTLMPLGTPEESQRVFCVNLNPAELDDTSLDLAALQKQVGETTPLFLISADDSPAATFSLLRSGVGLWQFFLIGVLAILVFETYWSNRQRQRQRQLE
ncbi:MAG: BatA and WFA domain-containing protein [Planctomycetia bacterium]|jgi:hypothetical protein